MRRLAGSLPAWLILMVIFTPFFAPIVGAEELGSVVYEPFPVDDDVPLVSQLDDELDGTADELDGAADVEPETIEPGIIEDREILDTDEIFAHDGSAEMAPVFSTADDIGPCNWYARGDFVLWMRSAPKGGVLAVDTSPITNLIQFQQAIENLNSVNAAPRIEPGARITLARHLGRDYRNRDHSVEVVFLGGLEWDGGGGKTSREPASLVTPLAPDTLGGFNRSDTQTFNVHSDFNSIELNARLQRRPHSDKMVLSPDGRWSRQMNNTFLTSFMAGMRYIRSTEQFRWSSVRAPTTTLVDLIGDGSGSGVLNIDTENNLIGLHIGSDTYWHTPCWRLGMRTQFGVMVNMAEQRTRGLIEDTTLVPNVDDNGNPLPPGPQVTAGPIQRGAEDEAAAFIAEMGWSATYQINDCTSFRASYDFLWMQGFADATRQIDFNFAAPDKVNFGGNVFQQGFSIGFEFLW